MLKERSTSTESQCKCINIKESHSFSCFLSIILPVDDNSGHAIVWCGSRANQPSGQPVNGTQRNQTTSWLSGILLINMFIVIAFNGKVLFLRQFSSIIAPKMSSLFDNAKPNTISGNVKMWIMTF